VAASLLSRHYSPLRYPGGKARLSQTLKDLIRGNRLLDGQYVEPFAGGAGAALSLLFGEFVSHIHINDVDASVHAFWSAVLTDTDSLCRLILDTRPSLAEWRRQRSIQTRRAEVDSLTLAFSTFFLNRTNRSGIIATGGVIGGLAQNGNYKLDARLNRSDLVRRIEQIASYRNRISLYRLDAIEMLDKVVKPLPMNTLVYLDPPYYVKGSRLYANYYNDADHERLSLEVKGLEQHWLVSYDNVPAIRKLYTGYKRAVYGLRYSACSREMGAEIMFFSKSLSVAKLSLPTR
jgi:DNA adenine methylase